MNENYSLTGVLIPRIVTNLIGKLEQFCTIIVKNGGGDLTYFLFNVCSYLWHASVQWKFFNKACLFEFGTV